MKEDQTGIPIPCGYKGPSVVIIKLLSKMAALFQPVSSSHIIAWKNIEPSQAAKEDIFCGLPTHSLD